jgi:hypothetical protein
MPLKYNPLLEENFQELNPAGAGGGDLQSTLLAGNITGGQSIVLSGSDAIKSTNSQLLLNDTFGAWLLTFSSVINGSTEFQTSYIWGDGISVFMEQGADSGIALATSSARMYMSNSASGLIGDAYMYLGLNQMGFGDETAVIFSTIQIKDNTSASKTSVSLSNRALFLNSNNSTINSGVSRSLTLGGDNLTVKTSNTPYANQISLQPSGNTFDGMLAPSAITADRAWTMPDKSGTVAILSVQTGQTTDGVQLTLTGSQTITNNSVQSFVTRITAIQSATAGAGTVGDVWVHEFKGVIKQIATVTSLVSTVSDEAIGEDVATAGFSVSIEAGTGVLDIKVTGELNKTIEWKAETIFNEVLI